MRIYLFTTLLTIVLATSAWAKSYLVGVEEIEYLPYWEGKGTSYSGFGKEYLEAFAKDENLQFTYVPFPVKRLYSELFEGKIDFKFPDVDYWQKDQKKGRSIHYSSGIVPFTDGVMRPGSTIGQAKEQIKRLGTVRFFTPFEYLDDITAKKIILEEVNSLDSLISMMKQGRIDAIYVNIEVAKRAQAKVSTPQDKVVLFDRSLPHTNSQYSISSLKHPDIIDRFNKWMKKNEALKKKLMQKWQIQEKQ